MFEYTDYRRLLKDQARKWKDEHPGWTLQKIASKAQIQPPYLTNVLQERAHLSADQLHAIGGVLKWSPEEIDFATLLLETERAGNPDRRKLLEKRASEIRKEKRKSQAHLKKAVVDPQTEVYTRFFLNPFYILINAFIGVDRFAKEPSRISKCLGLNASTLQAWLKDLAGMGFIKPSGHGFEKVKRNFHLPKDSVLCEPHQHLSQQIVSQHLMTTPESEKYGFTVTISADESTRQAIQEEFLKFLKVIEGKVAKAPAEELYGMRFDLFKWSHEKNS